MTSTNINNHYTLPSNNGDILLPSEMNELSTIDRRINMEDNVFFNDNILAIPNKQYDTIYHRYAADILAAPPAWLPSLLTAFQISSDNLPENNPLKENETMYNQKLIEILLLENTNEYNLNPPTIRPKRIYRKRKKPDSITVETINEQIIPPTMIPPMSNTVDITSNLSSSNMYDLVDESLSSSSQYGEEFSQVIDKEDMEENIASVMPSDNEYIITDTNEQPEEGEWMGFVPSNNMDINNIDSTNPFDNNSNEGLSNSVIDINKSISTENMILYSSSKRRKQSINYDEYSPSNQNTNENNIYSKFLTNKSIQNNGYTNSPTNIYTPRNVDDSLTIRSHFPSPTVASSSNGGGNPLYLSVYNLSTPTPSLSFWSTTGLDALASGSSINQISKRNNSYGNLTPLYNNEHINSPTTIQTPNSTTVSSTFDSMIRNSNINDNPLSEEYDRINTLASISSFIDGEKYSPYVPSAHLSVNYNPSPTIRSTSENSSSTVFSPIAGSPLREQVLRHVHQRGKRNDSNFHGKGINE